MKVEGPFAGYNYAALKTTDGYELYRAFAGWDSVAVSTGTLSNPAAGAQLSSITVPAGKRWLLVGASFQITTDANAANRVPALTARTDGTNTTIAVAPTAPVTASLTAVRVAFGPGGGSGGLAESNGLIFAGIGNGIELSAGSVVVIYVYNIQATDDILAGAAYAYKEVDA